MNVLSFCPQAPAWTVDWEGLRESYEWLAALHDCPQDPGHHAEGDVGTHTRMCCEALAGSSVFQALSARERQIAFGAVVLHDVAKPERTRRQGDSITVPGHSARGAIMARQLLWRQGVPFDIREAICGIVRYHQTPFFLLERADSERLAFRISQIAPCHLLALVALADAEGRRCADASEPTRMVGNVELFREYCAEHDCLTKPRAFASDHSRFVYFRTPGRDPTYAAHDDTICEVTVMSGMPAAGKDHWIEQHVPSLPVVSLDALRVELDIDPAAPQGPVVENARQRARALLRERRDFVWNATNLGGDIRESLISLCADYGARVRVVYVEAPEPVIQERNRTRQRPVPRTALTTMLNRWTIASPAEAHEVHLVVP